MADRDTNHLDIRLQPLEEKFHELCHAKGVLTFTTETYRSREQQDIDFAQGRTAPGKIITNARGGKSPHNAVDENGSPASCAFDFAIKAKNGTLDWDASDYAWQTAIGIGEGLGLISGSTWRRKDSAHMQLKEWTS
jgi:peptidoglycan L-alanyl-D-glutamate endopeptidase CwlK